MSVTLNGKLINCKKNNSSIKFNDFLSIEGDVYEYILKDDDIIEIYNYNALDLNLLNRKNITLKLNNTAIKYLNISTNTKLIIGDDVTFNQLKYH